MVGREKDILSCNTTQGIVSITPQHFATSIKAYRQRPPQTTEIQTGAEVLYTAYAFAFRAQFYL